LRKGHFGFRTFCAPTSGCHFFDHNFTLKNFWQNPLKMVGPMVTWQLSHIAVNRTTVQKPQNLIQNFLIRVGKCFALLLFSHSLQFVKGVVQKQNALKRYVFSCFKLDNKCFYVRTTLWVPDGCDGSVW
jgi:hypothetical protein